LTSEFKVEAVQLAKSSEKPLAQIARDLGIADSTLHHWCKLFSEQGEQAFAFQWTSDTTRRGDSPLKA
jgi:transposase